jgi:FkbH-like protein
MVLAESDFSALRINWQPKPENVLSIAAELNIGVDSFVFVDDNPDERELMRAMLPEVLTVEMPRDPALYRSTLERLPQLQVLTVTAEDRERPALYATSRLREAARVTASSLDEYLHSLEVTVAIRRAQPEGFARIVQLFARTNQFNTTTRRYDLPDVRRFATDERYGLYTLESRDRFGSHGVVAVGLIEHRGEESRIESFLMSCRVIGYGIEAAMLSQLAADARANGATLLRGEFIPTKKNAPAAGLFEQHGFVRVPGEPTLWELALGESSLPMPAWIVREA